MTIHNSFVSQLKYIIQYKKYMAFAINPIKWIN